VEAATSGEVGLKVYFGGIAGDDARQADRMARGQLDGVMSGGILCEQRAPSLRALRLVGFYRNRAEADFVAGRLLDAIAEEFHQSGFTLLGLGNLGPSDIFSRRPVRTLDDLRRDPLWQWDTDDVQRAIVEAMGLRVVPLPLEEATRAYGEGRIDGFLSVPSATLAFQWSVQARYVTDLQLSYLIGCVAVTNRALDRLTAEQQQIVRSAGARLAKLTGEIARQQDDALLGGLFQHQGLQMVPVSTELRERFFDAARAAREKLGDKLIPRALLARATSLVEEYRARR
jgi:TRAP-type transport system periplasmic protein